MTKLSAIKGLAYTLLAASGIVQGLELGARWALLLLILGLVALTYVHSREDESHNDVLVTPDTTPTNQSDTDAGSWGRFLVRALIVACGWLALATAVTGGVTGRTLAVSVLAGGGIAAAGVDVPWRRRASADR